MTEHEIVQLVGELEQVNAQQFWWDSPILIRAVATHDARIVRTLAFRHHCLGNKNAFSAHVLRNTMRHCDGPELLSLWACIDEESDSKAIVERMEDFGYLPWASAFIIGEIGGTPAFVRILERLSPEHAPRHYLIVRLFSHLLIRYLAIEKETEPKTTFIDLKTGEQESLLSRYTATTSFDMTARKRKEANELFTPLTREQIQSAKISLETIPDRLLNLDRGQFLKLLDHLRVHNAMRGGV